MSQGTKQCPKCKADVPVASMRCIECGARFGMDKPAGNSLNVGKQSVSSSSPTSSLTAKSNSMSIDDMMSMADDANSASNVVNPTIADKTPTTARKVVTPKPMVKRPIGETGTAQSEPGSTSSANTSSQKSGVSQIGAANPSGTGNSRPTAPPLRRPIKPGTTPGIAPPGKISESSETKTSSSDSSLISKDADQPGSSQSSIMSSSSKSSDGSSRSGIARKRKRPTQESGNASGVFSQEALGNKSARGSKRVLGNSSNEISLVTNEELQHAIRTAVNQPEPEIPALKVENEETGKKKKPPSPAQIQKQTQKLSAKLDSIKDDDTKTSLDTTREVLKELSVFAVPEVVNIIAPFIQDMRPTIGDTATKVLGETREPSALPFILKQLMSTEKTRVASAIVSLGALGDRRSVLPLLVTALEFPQFSLRVMDSIEQIGVAGVPVLTELAQQQDLGISLNAVIALGKLKDARSVETLIDLLDHESMNLRCHAAEALGEIGNKKCCSHLVRKLNDEKSQVRVNAVAALGKLGDEDAALGLLKCLKDEDEDVVIEAAKALGNCNGKIAIEPLQKLLGSSNDKVVMSACAALGKIGNEQTVVSLTKLLYLPESPSESQFMLEVIDSIRKLKSHVCVPALIDILDATDASVRQRVAETLGFIGDSRAAIPLENLFEREKSDEVRAAIIKALGEIGDHDSFDVVVKALDDVMIVRIKAVIALGQLKDEAGLMYLTPMLNDPSPELRYHACMALAEIGKKTVMHQIEPLVMDQNNLVQRGAFKALLKLGDERPEKEIIKSAKKRAPKKVATPTVSLSFDFASFIPNSMVGVISPDNPMLKWIAIGVASSVLVIFAGVGAYMFWPKPEVIIRMGYLQSVDLGPDASTIAIGRTYGVVQLVNNSGDRALVKIPIQPGIVNGVVNLGNDHFLATLAGNVVAIKNGSLTYPDGFSSTADFTKLKTSQDGTHIYTVDLNSAVRIYDAATLKIKSTLSVQKGTKVIAVSNNGELVASGPVGGVAIVQKGDGSLLHTFKHPQKSISEISSLAFSPDQKLLLTSFEDGSLILWSIETGKVIKIIGTKQSGNQSIRYGAMAFTSDPAVVVCLGLFGGSHKWNINDNKIVASGPPLNGADFSISRDCKKAAITVNEDSFLYMLDLDEFKTVQELSIPKK